MYNLNVNVNPSPTAAAGLLGVTAAEVTPRTPEIVNSLIAMTNPFDSYSHERSRDRADSTSSGGELSPPSVQHTCSQLIKEGKIIIIYLIIFKIYFYYLFVILIFKLNPRYCLLVFN